MSLALGELAILEGDEAAAAAPLWRVLDRDFDGQVLSSTTQWEANQRIDGNDAVPLDGLGLAFRLDGLRRQLGRGHKVFDPAAEWTQPWTVITLRDARDLAMSYLQRLAVREGGEVLEKVRAGFATATAHWIPEEQLLAWAVMGNVPAILEAAGAVLEQPAPTAETLAFTRYVLAEIRAMGNLPPAAETQAAELVKSLPMPKNAASRLAAVGRSWHEQLWQCFRLFDSKRFPEADQAFAACLRDFATTGLGPSPATWASFHFSTLNGLSALSKESEKQVAAAVAMRWLAQQTPRRNDWPSTPDPRLVWSTAKPPITYLPLFSSARGSSMQAYGSAMVSFFDSAGGALPSDLLVPLFFGAVTVGGLERDLDFADFTRRLGDLPPESQRLGQIATSVLAIFRRSGKKAGEMLEPLFATPDGALARVLATRAAVDTRSREDATDAVPVPLSAAVPQGPINRAAWLAAECVAQAQLDPAAELEAHVQALAALPRDAASERAVRDMLAIRESRAPAEQRAEIRAAIGKLSLSRLELLPTHPLESECAVTLETLTDAIEVERANALAKEVLAQPVVRASRSETTREAEKEALHTLHATGELLAWLKERRSTLSKGTTADRERLAALAGRTLDVLSSLDNEDASGSRGPDRAIKAVGDLARKIHEETIFKLVRELPAKPTHWNALSVILQRWNDEGREGREPYRGEKMHDPRHLARKSDWPFPLDVAAVAAGAASGLRLETAVRILPDDPDTLEALVKAWPIPSGFRSEYSATPSSEAVPIAETLWRAGREEAALTWMWKIVRAHNAARDGADAVRAMLLEMLALRHDEPGLLEALTLALHQAIPAPAILGAVPRSDLWGQRQAVTASMLPILEQAAQLDLLTLLRDALGKSNDDLDRELAILVGVAAHEDDVLKELHTALENPLRPQILEDLSEYLAKWPPGHEALRQVIARLEPAHTSTNSGERIEQLAHRGMLAAHAGATDQVREMLVAAHQAQRTRESHRVKVLLDLVEGFARAGHPREASVVANELGGLFQQQRYSNDPARERLLALARAGDREVYKILADGLQNGAKSDSALADALLWSERLLAVHAGQWNDLVPFLRVVQRADAEAAVEWTLRWKNPEASDTGVYVPDFSHIPNAADLGGSSYSRARIHRAGAFCLAADAEPAWPVAGCAPGEGSLGSTHHEQRYARGAEQAGADHQSKRRDSAFPRVV